MNKNIKNSCFLSLLLFLSVSAYAQKIEKKDFQPCDCLATIRPNVKIDSASVVFLAVDCFVKNTSFQKLIPDVDFSKRIDEKGLKKVELYYSANCPSYLPLKSRAESNASGADYFNSDSFYNSIKYIESDYVFEISEFDDDDLNEKDIEITDEGF